MSKAKLTIKYSGSGSDIKYEIRSGEKGTGKVLWECSAWDNPSATENAERMAFNFANDNKLTLTNSMEDGLY